MNCLFLKKNKWSFLTFPLKPFHNTMTLGTASHISTQNTWRVPLRKRTVLGTWRRRWVLTKIRAFWFFLIENLYVRSFYFIILKNFQFNIFCICRRPKNILGSWANRRQHKSYKEIIILKFSASIKISRHHSLRLLKQWKESFWAWCLNVESEQQCHLGLYYSKPFPELVIKAASCIPTKSESAF